MPRSTLSEVVVLDSASLSAPVPPRPAQLRQFKPPKLTGPRAKAQSQSTEPKSKQRWRRRITARQHRGDLLGSKTAVDLCKPWCPRQDSNLRPSAPEADALSPELRGRTRTATTAPLGLDRLTHRGDPLGHRDGFGARPPQPIGWTLVTPADLAELLKSHRLRGAGRARPGRAARCPQTVTVERPRNPEHGDYASNLALQLGKKVGANPRELAGWLAEALEQADGIAEAEVAGPGFVNLRLEASAQAIDRQQRHRRRAAAYGNSGELGRPQHQPRVRLGQPDRPDPHRRHPVGRRRRRAGPAAVHARAPP